MTKKKEAQNFIQMSEEDKVNITRTLASVDEYMALFENIVIENDDDMALASNVLNEIKTYSKAVESRKKEVTDPLNKALTAVRSWFKAPQEALAKAEAIVKEKMAAYVTSAKAAQLEALGDVSRATDDATATEALAKAASLEGRAEGTRVSMVWDFEITDFDQIPREFLLINRAAVLQYARENEGGVIPGVRLFQKPQIAAVGKK